MFTAGLRVPECLCILWVFTCMGAVGENKVVVSKCRAEQKERAAGLGDGTVWGGGGEDEGERDSLSQGTGWNDKFDFKGESVECKALDVLRVQRSRGLKPRCRFFFFNFLVSLVFSQLQTKTHMVTVVIHPLTFQSIWQLLFSHEIHLVQCHYTLNSVFHLLFWTRISPSMTKSIWTSCSSSRDWSKFTQSLHVRACRETHIMCHMRWGVFEKHAQVNQSWCLWTQNFMWTCECVYLTDKQQLVCI